MSRLGLMEDDELVTAAEIARRLGLARPQAVYTWRRRNRDFPEPVAVATVWRWGDVRAWAEATGHPRGPGGRPRGTKR
jgi:predicted DNA-binding transcriptional regulator AlpA